MRNRQPPSQFSGFEASELFCPRCRTARPVRKRLLLVLPTGNRFEYLCASCGASCGAQDDGDRQAFSLHVSP